jgi:sugar fermentation stimulation protein A
MKFPELIQAKLVRRDNRFRITAQVDGNELAAHCPNPGRIKELLYPGVTIWISEAVNKNRKTAFDLKLVEKDNILVSLDSRLPNPLFEEALLADRIEGFDYPIIRREVTREHSRFDFHLSGNGSLWVEAKSCTLVTDRVANFPDAPTLRGQRHMRELTEAANLGEKSAVIFVVQRPDADSFTPNDATDPEFGKRLREAADSGVIVRAFACEVDLEQIQISREIEVDL